jgi:hypothetical protein
MDPVVRAVSSCIDQSEGREVFPKLEIQRLINVSRERRSLVVQNNVMDNDKSAIGKHSPGVNVSKW